MRSYWIAFQKTQKILNQHVLFDDEKMFKIVVLYLNANIVLYYNWHSGPKLVKNNETIYILLDCLIYIPSFKGQSTQIFSISINIHQSILLICYVNNLLFSVDCVNIYLNQFRFFFDFFSRFWSWKSGIFHVI